METIIGIFKIISGNFKKLVQGDIKSFQFQGMKDEIETFNILEAIKESISMFKGGRERLSGSASFILEGNSSSQIVDCFSELELPLPSMTLTIRIRNKNNPSFACTNGYSIAVTVINPNGLCSFTDFESSSSIIFGSNCYNKAIKFSKHHDFKYVYHNIVDNNLLQNSLFDRNSSMYTSDLENVSSTSIVLISLISKVNQHERCNHESHLKIIGQTAIPYEYFDGVCTSIQNEGIAEDFVASDCYITRHNVRPSVKNPKSLHLLFQPPNIELNDGTGHTMRCISENNISLYQVHISTDEKLRLPVYHKEEDNCFIPGSAMIIKLISKDFLVSLEEDDTIYF